MTTSKFSHLLLLASLLMMMSCATNNRNAYEELRKKVDGQMIDEAISLVKSDEFYPEKRSQLLKLLELAKLQHIKGDYYQSLLNFDKAKELSDALFTVSVSKKVLSALINDNMDHYYGEIYERSKIRFYQALNHYMLYQTGWYEAHTIDQEIEESDKVVIKQVQVEAKELSENERRAHLAGARATLLEWDSLLDNYNKMYAGESSYKVDLSSRLFGAFIHEQMGTNADRGIALGLYKDAKKILFRNYNLYPVFNENHKKFASDYEKLPELSEKKVKKDYVKSTKHAKDLMAFIDSKIKNFNAQKRNNVTVLLQQGYVAEKEAKVISFPLPVDTMARSDDAVEFASRMLNTPKGAVPTITFELPQVVEKKTTKEISLIVKDKAGEVVSTSQAIIINPISDIAYQTLDNKIVSTYSKVGARLAAKHIAAIMAAYEVYKSSGELLASITYLTSNKVIAASEKADLRFWSTLPHTVRMASFDLAPGDYSLIVKTTEGEKTTERPWKDFSVTDNQAKLLNLNVM